MSVNSHWDFTMVLLWEFFLYWKRSVKFSVETTFKNFSQKTIISFCSHLTYIETLWNEACNDPMEMFCPDAPSLLTIYGLVCTLQWPLNIGWPWCTPMCHWLRDITLSSSAIIKLWNQNLLTSGNVIYIFPMWRPWSTKFHLGPIYIEHQRQHWDNIDTAYQLGIATRFQSNSLAVLRSL